MMTKKQIQEATYIQSLSVAQLKALEANIKWAKIDLSGEPNIFEEHDDYIQSLSLEELRIYASDLWRSNIDDDDEDNDFDYTLYEQRVAAAEPQTPYGIEAKMQQTGLTKKQILTIEKDKTQATLAELMLYCEGLNINLQDFISTH